MADDWFRRSTWSEEDRRSFFARLARSRTRFHKAQYLRIQALHLEQTGRPDLVRHALELLEQVLKEWPEPSQLASTYHQQGTCHLQLEQPLRAIDCFRKALAAEREHPGVRTHAATDLAWLVATGEMTAYYSEALAVLPPAEELAFPVQRFKVHGARALILAATGDVAAGRAEAARALDACATTHSGFRHHRDLGLVDERYGGVMLRLQEIQDRGVAEGS
jgi:tetratricopeptide (TPR) repeat protein